MGWIINKVRITFWTAFYYTVSGLVFESLGKKCSFHGWIDIPQRGGKIYIGDGTHICRRTVLTVTKSASLLLGNNSYLGVGTIISVHGRVVIGNDVLIGEYVSIHDNDHETRDLAMPISRQGFVVGSCVLEDGCWVGAGAIILKDAKLGANSVLAAGAVLTTSLPGGVVAGGVPARILKCRGMNG